MKKKISVLLVVGIMLTITFFGCGNKQLIDTNFKFDKAVIDLGYEVITVEVKSWKDFDDGEYQIITTNGEVYLTHSSRCVIIKSAE